MILQKIKYKDLENWSVKFLINNAYISSKFPLEKLGDILTPIYEKIEKKNYKGQYEIVKKIYFDKEEIELRKEKKTGMDLYKVLPGNLLISNINFHQGAVALNRFNKVIVASTHYQPYIINLEKVLPDYLILVLRSDIYKNYICLKKTEGIKTELKYKHIKEFKIPLPDINIQEKLIEKYQKIKERLDELKREYPKLLEQFEKELFIVGEKEKKLLLQKVKYKDLENWSVKFIIQTTINSKYPIQKLKSYIKEQKCKISPYNYPNKKFKILGVNNKVGLFDNEIKLGKEINQDYKIVRFKWFAYNPYRINVGSIGLKTNEQKYRYISPAYVVFSIEDKKLLLPEYLYLIFKTKTFLNVIKNSTKGSVRQILSYDILENLKIPLPDINTQKQLVTLLKHNVEEQKKLEKELEVALKEFENKIFS